MLRPVRPSVARFVTAASAAVLLATACGPAAPSGSPSQSPDAATPVPPIATPTKTSGATTAPLTVAPTVHLTAVNGSIPILEYHKFGSQNGRWERSLSSFQSDLNTLYAEGFVPVDLRDLGDAVLPAPPGKHPIVLTFDDGSPGQFQWNAQKTAPSTDSGAGVLWAFCQTHPTWKFRPEFRRYGRARSEGVVTQGF